MKKFFIFIASILLLSCEDFLDTKNLTKKDTSTFPTTESDVDMLIAATYQSIVQTYPLNNPFFVSDLVSDDRFGGAGYGDKNNRAIGRLLRNGENQFSNPWQDRYSAIFRSNTFFENIDKVSWSNNEMRNAKEGEMLFLRGYAYMDLCRTYGTVPLILSTERNNLPRATPDELWGQIAADFKAAIEKLPSTPFQDIDKSKLGHATKWAAEALMARAWLFYTGYYQKDEMPLAGGGSISKQQVIDWLLDLKENSGHGLLKNFWSLWPYSNEETSKDYTYMKNIKRDYSGIYGDITWIKEDGDNIENIFCYKFSTLGDIYGESAGNQMVLYGSIRGWNIPEKDKMKIFPLGLGWGGGPVNPQLWDEWKADEPNDIRRQASIMNVNDPNEIEKYFWGEDKQMEETGYWNKKYIAMNAKRSNKAGEIEAVNYSVILFNASDDYRRNNTQDTYIVRYADVLLMLSELTKDVSYMNDVRKRAGLSALSSYSEEALRRERRYELCFEGSRYYDLLRWHIAEEQLEKKNGVPICNQGVWTTADMGDIRQRVKDTGGFFPIPVDQINLSGGVLVQDEAWAGVESIYID